MHIISVALDCLDEELRGGEVVIYTLCAYILVCPISRRAGMLVLILPVPVPVPVPDPFLFLVPDDRTRNLRNRPLPLHAWNRPPIHRAGYTSTCLSYLIAPSFLLRALDCRPNRGKARSCESAIYAMHASSRVPHEPVLIQSQLIQWFREHEKSMNPESLNLRARDNSHPLATHQSTNRSPSSA